MKSIFSLSKLLAVFLLLSFSKSFAQSHADRILKNQIRFDTPDGKYAFAQEFKSTSASKFYVLLFPENILDAGKDAERLRNDLGNVNVIAMDINDNAINMKKSPQDMEIPQEERMEAIIKGVLTYIGKDAKIATIGQDDAGKWALQTAVMVPEQTLGCITYYYAEPDAEVEDLKKIKAPVTAVFATKDTQFAPEELAAYQSNMKAAGCDLKVYQLEAKRNFANSYFPAYDKEATEKAYQLSTTFLKSRFK